MNKLHLVKTWLGLQNLVYWELKKKFVSDHKGCDRCPVRCDGDECSCLDCDECYFWNSKCIPITEPSKWQVGSNVFNKLTGETFHVEDITNSNFCQESHIVTLSTERMLVKVFCFGYVFDLHDDSPDGSSDSQEQRTTVSSLDSDDEASRQSLLSETSEQIGGAVDLLIREQVSEIASHLSKFEVVVLSGHSFGMVMAQLVANELLMGGWDTQGLFLVGSGGFKIRKSPDSWTRFERAFKEKYVHFSSALTIGRDLTQVTHDLNVFNLPNPEYGNTDKVVLLHGVTEAEIGLSEHIPIDRVRVTVSDSSSRDESESFLSAKIHKFTFYRDLLLRVLRSDERGFERCLEENQGFSRTFR
jgi:hypothetical protein